jgi:hypothetical protein
MSDDRELPRTADEVGEFMNNLVFEELPTAQDEADTLASLPASSEVMVVRSVRLPIELDQSVADAAMGGRRAKEHLDPPSDRDGTCHAG